jgi:signal transduction histidine kinase
MKRSGQLWVTAAAALLLAILVGVGGAILFLHESRHAVIAIAEYLLASAGGALVIGVLGITLGMRALPRLSLKVALGYAVSSVAAIITILVTPLLMFRERSDLYLLVLLLASFIAVSLGFATMIGVSVARRLEDMRDSARRIEAGDLDVRVRLDGRDELAELGEAFNRMAGSLRRSFEERAAMEQSRRELVASISHDLRTPLAAMRAMLEAVQDGVVSDADTVAEYHGAIHHEIVRMQRLIDDLFDLSRLEAGEAALDIVSVDVHELIEEITLALRREAEERGVYMELDTRSCLVRVDPGQAQRVVANLLQNSLRHTPQGGTIRVAVHPSSEEVTVEVADTGEGIPDLDLPHVFDRFYRSEKSRSRDSGGAGLGLAISKAIIEAHHGRIWAESAARGARILFTLPAGGGVEVRDADGEPARA